MTDKKPKFRNRSSKRLFKMANNNSEWVRSDTEECINIIVDFLIDEYEKTGKKNKFTFSKIAKETGINPETVSTAVHLICLKKDPKFLMFGEKYTKKNGEFRTIMRVKMRGFSKGKVKG